MLRSSAEAAAPAADQPAPVTIPPGKASMDLQNRAPAAKEEIDPAAEAAKKMADQRAAQEAAQKPDEEMKDAPEGEEQS